VGGILNLVNVVEEVLRGISLVGELSSYTAKICLLNDLSILCKLQNHNFI
jgi:hypothetical protein